jgi:hypothetical protein
MVLDHLPGDPRHLRRLPCEYVGICLEEGDERELPWYQRLRGSPSVVWASGLCRQGMQLLYGRKRGGAVAPHGEDPGWRRHLEDQIPVMGNGHEPVQGRPADGSVEGEVNLRDVEHDVLRAEVLLGPECNRESDAVTSQFLTQV